MLESRDDLRSAPHPGMRRGTLAMLLDVRTGLIDGAGRGQRELPPKYFYDHRGSELFEEITRLPEYYLTRIERALLAARMPEWVAFLQPRALLELGSGSADKTRVILDAMQQVVPEVVYLPVDVSAEFLDEAAVRLRAEYPDVRIQPVVADFNADTAWVPTALPRPMLAAFLGSTIGNLDDADAVRVLARLRDGMRPGDRLVLGADLVKDRAVIEAAYNDTRGVTAAFNRNMLVVLNRELGSDFDPAAFAHQAFYVEEPGRIEMHLVARTGQRVHIPSLGTVTLRPGETIRTEISNKYTYARLARILSEAGLNIAVWETDDAGGYALLLAQRRD